APHGGNIALDSYRGVVISGGSLSKDAVEETLQWYRRFLDKVKVPVLGVCLGMKIIGRCYDARIRRLETDETGATTLTFHRPYPLAPNHAQLVVHEDHSFELISLPKGFDNYASSSRCNIQAVKHRDKPLFAVQFHPEVTENNQGRIILDNFLTFSLRYAGEAD
ncbi:MAG: hypothetical protein ACE5PO_06370, partial [Candidatus Bathyarchaeia archaeon]